MEDKIKELTSKNIDMKEKYDNLLEDVKMHKRLLDKANNSSYSYLMADLEKGEKDLAGANKKIRKFSDESKKMEKENSNLKITVRGLQDDLRKLLNKR